VGSCRRRSSAWSSSTRTTSAHHLNKPLDDKLSIVDVKARDAAGCHYQIKIQLLVLPELPARILSGWADLYSAQLPSGEDYLEPKPTYAIWLLGESLLPDVLGYAHRYRFCDAAGPSPDRPRLRCAVRAAQVRRRAAGGRPGGGDERRGTVAQAVCRGRALAYPLVSRDTAHWIFTATNHEANR
jgi:hypothetical protein